MTVHSSRDTMMSFPSAVGSVYTYGIGLTVQWIMCTPADYHGAL